MSTVSAVLVVLYIKLRGGLKDFSFSYTVEKENDSKITFAVDSHKNCRIDKLLFSANKVETPSIEERILTDKEYKKIKNKLERCNFFKMKDVYNTDNADDNRVSAVSYLIYFSSKKKEKRIFIKNKEQNKLPSSFRKLSEYLDTVYIDNSHL